MDTFTTMITPYQADGSVDLGAVEAYTNWYVKKGLDGIFAVCQSSEIFYLSLQEREAINRKVYDTVQKLKQQTGRDVKVVSSGHVSYDFEEQVRELCTIADSGTDSLILITNRLDPHNEGDDVFLKNAEKLLSRLPKDVKLGLYECPYPYKRLVTPRILDWCLKTGRFNYMKDTCCDLATLKQRSQQLKGSGFKLLNANCQTLLQSYRDGAQGYCGIMCNFHPELYTRLADIWETNPEEAELLQAVICQIGFTEGGLPYPLTAKYHMTLEGIPSALISRTRPGDRMNDYAMHCVDQMKKLTDHMVQQWRNK